MFTPPGGIRTYDSPDRAVRAFIYLVFYRRNREILYETPYQVPINDSTNLSIAASQIELALAEARKTLSEIESKALLSAFGIRTTIPQPAYSADDAVQIARELGYPIFLKINSSQIVHKTEVQSVVLGVASDEEMKLAFNDMTARAKRLRPDADVHDIKVQAIRPKCWRIGRSNCRRSMSGSHGAFSIHCACPSSGISSSTVKLMAFSFEILYLRITAREFAMKFA